MKEKINVLDYASDILKANKKGIVLTTKYKDKVNSMIISWGMLGIQWNKNIFIAFIREHRFTQEMLKNNPEFTISIPVEKVNPKIIKSFGMQSGKNVDKIKEAGVTLVESEKTSVPAIKELPLTLECKVVYKQAQDYSAIAEENKKAFYPQDVDSSYWDSNKDFHTAFYGEIVDAYIIK